MGLITIMIPFLNKEARFARNLRENTRNIHINPAEQARIRQQLLVLMERYPLPEHSRQGTREGRRFNIPVTQLFSLRPASFATGLLVGVFMVTGGGAMAYAAQDSLPGDILYGVKINVNERVESALAISIEAEGEVVALHAERRLQEAAILVSQGRLTEQLNKNVEDLLEEKIEALDGVIAVLNEKQNYEAAFRLQTILEGKIDAHAEILDRLQEKEKESASTTNIDSVEHLRSFVRENEKELKKNIESTIKQVKETDDEVRSRVALAAQESAGQSVEAAQKTVNAMEGAISDQASDQARGEIAKAEKSYAQGEKYLKDGFRAEAAASFYQATSLANKALVIMKTNIDIDWGSNGTREDDSLENPEEQEQEQNQEQPQEPGKDSLSSKTVVNSEPLTKETASSNEETRQDGGTTNTEIVNTDTKTQKKSFDQKLEAGMNEIQNKFQMENFFPFSSE